MMIHCRERITQSQVDLLQTFKDRAADFDSTQKEYAALLNFDIDRYKVDESLPVEQQ